MTGFSVTYSVVDNATKQIDAINRRIAASRAPMERLSKQMARFVDVSGLSKVASGFEWIGKAAFTALRSLTAVAGVMGILTSAGSIAGMARLVGSYAAWSKNLKETADSVNLSTQELQLFGDATRLAGGSVEDMSSGLKSLHDNLAAATANQNNDAKAAMLQLGVTFADANNRLLPMTQVLPEVVRKLSEIKDPAARAALETRLFGADGQKLVDVFRNFPGGIDAAIEGVKKLTPVTAEQHAAFRAFNSAVGAVSNSFDHLGQQIAATLSVHFTPLLLKLAEFTDKHSPEIIAAVDKISRQFAAWLGGVDWTKVEAGVEKLIAGLKSIADNFETIQKVATFLLVFMVGKWALGMVGAFGQVEVALGTTGLLGKLLAVTNAATLAFGALQKMQDAKTFAPENLAAGSPLWEGIPEDVQRQYPNSPLRQKEQTGSSFLQNPFGWMQERLGFGGKHLPYVAPPKDLNLPAEQKARGGAITSRLAKDLNLPTDVAAGITGNLQAESKIRAVQEANPLNGGRGGFGWAQWTGPRRDAFMAYAKANNLDPKSDEANYGYLMTELQSEEYAGLREQLRALKPGPNRAKEAAALVEKHFERPKESNAAVRGKYADDFAAEATKVTVAQPEPVNGRVDVGVKFDSPPPNTAVTASGTGAVNVEPVRVENQQMAGP